MGHNFLGFLLLPFESNNLYYAGHKYPGTAECGADGTNDLYEAAAYSGCSEEDRVRHAEASAGLRGLGLFTVLNNCMHVLPI